MSASSFRLFFVSDLHGSTTCFRKLLNTSRTKLRPDILVVGGDITAKRLVPYFEEAGRLAFLSDHRQQYLESGGLDESAFLQQCERKGAYAVRCDKTVAIACETDPKIRDDLLVSAACERLSVWMSLAEEKLRGTDVQLFVNAGNDDPPEIDAILDRSSRCNRPEGKVVDLPNGVTMVSCGYTNRTPWNSFREEDEEDLYHRLVNYIVPLEEKVEKAIFNFHCPPLGTQLDIAPKLDPSTLKPRAIPTGVEMDHVGSRAVYDAILNFHPAVSLHGHIHESRGIQRIGRTTACNPGSTYSNGQLQGVLLDFNPNGNLVRARLTSEQKTRSDTQEHERTKKGILHMIPLLGKFLQGRSEYDLEQRLEAMDRRLHELSSKVDRIIMPTETQVASEPTSERNVDAQKKK